MLNLRFDTGKMLKIDLTFIYYHGCCFHLFILHINVHQTQ